MLVEIIKALFTISDGDGKDLKMKYTTEQGPTTCPSKMRIVQTQTVPYHGPCVVGIYTALSDEYRGKGFRVTVEELEQSELDAHCRAVRLGKT
jgi:hypothetical protein